MHTVGLLAKASAMDQGSVLVHNTKTDLHRCDVLQPEVVPEAVIIKARTSGA